MPPGEYFIEYIPLIRNTVFHVLIVNCYYRMDQLDELVQKINELLLIREQKIIGSYKGKARFSTYLSVVIENMCREIRNSERKRRYRFVSFSDIKDFKKISEWMSARPASEISPSQKLMIKEAVSRLNTILRTYPVERDKIEFCLKAIFRIPIHFDDLKHHSITDETMAVILTHIDAMNNPDICKTKTQVYDRLTKVFGVLEQKSNTDDAIRKWIDEKISELIMLLNGDPPEYTFTRETFQYLFDYYCKSSKTEFQKKFHDQSNI
ncbi:MAG TPA: hypothetical protein PKN44_07995 [Bacteroidales bacterium]|nr:hypothetical protein [Bacteroidales bacterium]